MMLGLNRNFRLVGHRILMIVAVLWGAATLSFMVVKFIPGDPVSVITGGEGVVDEAVRAEIIHQFGLDKPVWQQYINYTTHALTGDLGQSYLYRQPVISVIGNGLKETLPLALGGLGFALVVSIINAVFTAGRRHQAKDLIVGLELILLSTPVYWIGILLLSIFSFSLQWFPVTGNDGVMSLVLPVITLSLPLIAVLSQVLRDGMEEALAQPFATTVRTRGVSEFMLRARHILRHAALAISTLTGTLLASVLAGSVLTETVFGRAGIGQIMLGAIENRDMPLVLGLVMFSAFLFVVINLLIDGLYVLIDPRLRKQEAI
ncbi:ABC transporter permease [Providencia rettgeri]|uniref:ABC transporter permease n=1 Tax=Providencia rettgeri TaxID=587 RepID=UPI0034E086A0